MPLRFRHFEPYVIPKKSLTGSSVERVDTRVLQVVYTIERTDLPIFIGQQMDMFIESVERPSTSYTSASTKRNHRKRLVLSNERQGIHAEPSTERHSVCNRDYHYLTWPLKKSDAWLPLLVTGLLVTGCAVGPDYRSPDLSIPESWSEQSADKAVIAPVSIAQWWKAFNDPTLDSLIAQAVESNHDLRIAEARIREARALHRVAASDLWPTVNTAGSYSRSRRSIGNTSIPQAAPVERNLFQTGFDASWEVDVFGGNRRATEAAKADIDAAVENRRDTQITLLAEVARNYIELRGFQRRLDIFVQCADAGRRGSNHSGKVPRPG